MHSYRKIVGVRHGKEVVFDFDIHDTDLIVMYIESAIAYERFEVYHNDALEWNMFGKHIDEVIKQRIPSQYDNYFDLMQKGFYPVYLIHMAKLDGSDEDPNYDFIDETEKFFSQSGEFKLKVMYDREVERVPTLYIVSR
jgi:hypothetical protein